MPSSSFPVGKTVGAISCTTMTLFTKCYPPPLGTRINNTVPALKTTTVNRPVPALKKKRPSRREQKIQPPGPGAEKTRPPRPVPPRKKKKTAPSRLGKKIQPPRPASEKNNNRPVPLREKKNTAPSRLGKKKPRPVPPRKKNNRPVPPRTLPRKIPSRPVPPRISTPIFCQSRAPAEMKKVGQPSIFPPSRPVEILAVHVKPCLFTGFLPSSAAASFIYLKPPYAIGSVPSYRVTRLHTDGVHCRESAGTGPVNLKVVPNECCLGRSLWTN